MFLLSVSMRKLLLALALGVALVAGGACGGAEEPEATCERGGITLDSGLRYTDLTCGRGTPAQRGHTATVRYSGELANGVEFDSSERRGGSYTFRLGVGQVISGWDTGMIGMQVGGIRRLVIPPDLAYGRAGFPPRVPPGATVIYEIELLDLKEPQV
jgi:FKBP-type peptidyl-prolyl cis-trans isomerase FkpA